MTLSDKQYLQINQALHCLTHAYESRMMKEEQKNPLDLLLSDRAVVMILGQFAQMNSQQLSNIMDINPGTISVYVQRLTKKGIIQKDQDQKDRRNWLLQLTDLGHSIYQETISGTIFYTRDFLSSLSEQEQKSLHQLLLKTSKNLGFEWILQNQPVVKKKR